jgi:hypothetical protein
MVSEKRREKRQCEEKLGSNAERRNKNQTTNTNILAQNQEYRERKK